MVLSRRKNRKNKSRKNKSRKSIQRGGQPSILGYNPVRSLESGLRLGRFLTQTVFRQKPSRIQRMKNVYDQLRKFIEWNFEKRLMRRALRQCDRLVWSMFRGLFGVINIQTADDVIAFEMMNVRTGSGILLEDDDNPGPEAIEEKRRNIEMWEAAGKPEPIIGDIMKNAVKILDAAWDKIDAVRTLDSRQDSDNIITDPRNMTTDPRNILSIVDPGNMPRDPGET